MSQPSPLTHSVSQEFIKVQIRLTPQNDLSSTQGMPNGRYLAVKGSISAAPVEVSAKPTRITFSDSKPELRAEIAIGKEGQAIAHRTFEETFFFRQLETEKLAMLEALGNCGKGKTQTVTFYISKEHWEDTNTTLQHLLLHWWSRFKGDNGAAGSYVGKTTPPPGPRGRCSNLIDLLEEHSDALDAIRYANVMPIRPDMVLTMNPLTQTWNPV